MSNISIFKDDVINLKANDKIQDATIERHDIYFKIMGIGIGYVGVVVTGIAIALIVKMI